MKEVKLLREEIRELKDILIPEVKPEEEEIKAIEKRRAEYKRGEYIRKAFRTLKKNRKAYMLRNSGLNIITWKKRAE